jgi:predicted dienelactone hydrolase
MLRQVNARIVAVLAIAAITLGAALPVGAQAAPPAAPGDVGPGTPTYAVGKRTIEITSEPGRVLSAEVWYPADPAEVVGVAQAQYTFPGLAYSSSVAYDSPPVSAAGPFPLVVYSHGSGGLRYVSSFLTEALAARGFVVVAVDHTGNTALDAFAGTELPRDEIVRIRPVDIRAEIDAMATASADPASPFAGAVDADRVGLVGHSAGSTGVLLTAAGRDAAEADPRIKAVVGMGPYVDPISDDELASLDLPVMLISGTRDTTTPIKTQTAKAFKKIPGDPLIRVDLKDAGHQSFTDVCYYQELIAATPGVAAPVVEAVDDFAKEACLPKFLPIAKAHTLIDRYAIGFFERYVDGDKAAAKLLKPTDPKIVTVTVKR